MKYSGDGFKAETGHAGKFRMMKLEMTCDANQFFHGFFSINCNEREVNVG